MGPYRNSEKGISVALSNFKPVVTEIMYNVKSKCLFAKWLFITYPWEGDWKLANT